MVNRQRVISGITVLVVLVAVSMAAFFVAELILNRPDLQAYVVSFGYLGITALATIAGLNVIILISAASLVPIFTTAGLYLPFIIVCLTLGTLMANFIGYKLSQLAGQAIIKHYSANISWLENLYTKHSHLVIPAIFLYAAFVPFPNEIIILPLALLGMKFRYLLLPLFLGNLVNQTIYAYGMQNLFQWFL